MKHRIALALLLPVFLLAFVAATPAPLPVDVHADNVAQPVGGRDYFFCATFQIIKYVGMATARPEAVLAGAIGSGVACAYGW
jgi:hypothetical protein